jgi:uncharacterized protein YgbK (DUF1537 family)
MGQLLLGCIADDLTGATDLADTLVRQGMQTVQLIGAPDERPDQIEAEAVVVALKCRSLPADRAVQQCLAALDWLRQAGRRQFFWKYCSTFDSTEQGNIGPVAEALLQRLDSELTIVCPAFPDNQRTVYKGHLFVGDLPLHESSMRHHPLNPMTDSSLLRLMGWQVKGRVGLIPWEVVRRGHAAIHAALDALRAEGVRFAVVDALDNQDLARIGQACAQMPLITGGSGIARGLPENFRRQGELPGRTDAAQMPPIPGKSVILAGSCSEATRRQIERVRGEMPLFQLDPLQLAEQPEAQVAAVLDWWLANAEAEVALVYSSAAPDAVQAVQRQVGREAVGRLVEEAFTQIAATLRQQGVRRFLVAGGETAGAVVNGLDVTGLRIGPRIDPGVPWTSSLEPEPVALALKSGNFGSPDFFVKALDMLA